MKKHTIAKIIVLSLLTSNAFAGGSAGLGVDGMSVGAKIGTLGLGIEAIKPLNDKLDLRLGLNKFDYDADETLDGTKYNAKLDMQTFAALGDFHPTGNGFFVSGGAMANNNSLGATATANAADPIDIGNTRITSGTATANVSFDDVSPYLGVGYRGSSTKAKGWTFTADAGVLFQGDPKITLSESTGLVSQADINKEIDSVRDDVDALKNLPVLSLGAAYRF